MIAILQTTNPVDISFAEALLKEAGIGYFIADQHMSITEGSVGIFPKRVMVDQMDEKRARQLIIDAGLLT